jgi:hypothetical protein
MRFTVRSPRTVLFAAVVAALLLPGIARADQTFSNSTGIAINDSDGTGPAAADPYPSQISVSGITGNVTAATATLRGFTHFCPQDVDVLLVGPTGADTVLMSDGGDCQDGTEHPPIDLTFSDSAANSIPCTTTAGTLLSGGTYKPKNWPDTDCANNNPDWSEHFVTPAPAGPWPTSMSGFAGEDPNGAWNLYVVDDSNGDAGAIHGGWSLSLAIASPTVGAPSITGTPAVGQTLTAVSGSSTGGGAQSFAWSRCESGGGNCAQIATGANYVVTSDDAGHALIVTETVTNSGGSASADSTTLEIPSAGPTATTGPTGPTEPPTGPTGPPPPPPAAPVQFSTKAQLTQSILKAHAVLVSFSSSSGGQLVASGTVSVPGAARTYRLVTVRKSVAAGSTQVKLKLPRSALNAIKRALARHRKLSAKITLTLTAPGGAKTAKKLTVRLK